MAVKPEIRPIQFMTIVSPTTIPRYHAVAKNELYSSKVILSTFLSPPLILGSKQGNATLRFAVASRRQKIQASMNKVFFPFHNVLTKDLVFALPIA